MAVGGLRRDHMQDSGSFVSGFAFQVPNWAVLVLLAVVLYGAWKLARLIWSALSN